MVHLRSSGEVLIFTILLWTFLGLPAGAVPQSAATTASTAAAAASSSSNATQIISVDGPINSTLEATAWALIVGDEC